MSLRDIEINFTIIKPMVLRKFTDVGKYISIVILINTGNLILFKFCQCKIYLPTLILDRFIENVFINCYGSRDIRLTY